MFPMMCLLPGVAFPKQMYNFYILEGEVKKNYILQSRTLLRHPNSNAKSVNYFPYRKITERDTDAAHRPK